MIPCLRRSIGYGLALAITLLCQPLSNASEGVKTYYKQYSVFSFEGEDYLCEPYLVKKDDWLYKIFRRKGEISTSDFPRFLSIFRKINPKLNNIDAIAPGHQILIPLKRVDKKNYPQQPGPGVVEVPVLEFSIKFKEKDLARHVRKYTVRTGDTVSGLLGREFLKKGGGVSEAGKKTFSLLNPEIRDIHRIYKGTQVLLPDPSILSQPWFTAFLAREIPAEKQAEQQAGPPGPGHPFSQRSRPVLSQRDLSRLKRYARLIRGTLMHQGTLHFPGQGEMPAQVLDLSTTPVLKEESGRKSVILPPDTLPEDFDQDLLAAMKAYWKKVRLRALESALSQGGRQPELSLDALVLPHSGLLETLVSVTDYTFRPNQKIPVALGNITMPVMMGRITHPDRPDLLVNTGSVYGQALDAIKSQGYAILTLSPDMTAARTCLKLFSSLGYTTWKNPAFSTENQVETIYGVYAVKHQEKVFIARTAPSERAKAFLDREGVRILTLEETP